jgi:hypothetical protein
VNEYSCCELCLVPSWRAHHKACPDGPLKVAGDLADCSKRMLQWAHFKGIDEPVLILFAKDELFARCVGLSGHFYREVSWRTYQGPAPIALEASGSVLYSPHTRPTWTRLGGRQFQEGVDW